MTPNARKLAKPARAIVAIAAAYALVLQVLLLSVVASGAVTMAAADGSVICIGGKVADGSGQPSHSPAGFAECTLACAQGFGGSAILPGAAALISAAPLGAAIERAAPAAFVLAARPSPRLSQGPPQIA